MQRKRRRVALRVLGKAAIAGLAALVFGLSGGTAASRATHTRSNPPLGLPWNTQPSGGYGVARPRAIRNGGPTAEIDNIRWKTWGGAKAVGHGTGCYTNSANQPADQCQNRPVTVIAFNLGSCAGSSRQVYRDVQWYSAMRYANKTIYDACLHLLAMPEAAPAIPAALVGETNCGTYSDPSANINANQVFAEGVGCATARSLVEGAVSSPGPRNGWYCSGADGGYFCKPGTNLGAPEGLVTGSHIRMVG